MNLFETTTGLIFNISRKWCTYKLLCVCTRVYHFYCLYVHLHRLENNFAGLVGENFQTLGFQITSKCTCEVKN